VRLMAALGEDPERWDPSAIRSFFLDGGSHCGRGAVEKLTTSLSAFLRYLAVKGHCRAGLADVVPGYATGGSPTCRDIWLRSRWTG
jgi:hypothetical protein